MHLNLLKRRLKLAYHYGFVRTVNIVIDRIALHTLRLFFGFAKWHANAPLSARSYRRIVAELVNGLRPKCVVEVGCGLGSILALVHAPERWGYDIDHGAIRAARLLRDRSINFRYGSIQSVTAGQIDVLILVNWIHELAPEELEQLIIPLVPRTRFLLLDAIYASNDCRYRYKHSFDFLRPFADPVRTFNMPEEGRSFIVMQIRSNRSAATP